MLGLEVMAKRGWMHTKKLAAEEIAVINNALKG